LPVSLPGPVGKPVPSPIGAVAGLREQLAWAESRPLHGRRIVVTGDPTDPVALIVDEAELDIRAADINADGSFVAAGPGSALGPTSAAVCPQLTPALPPGTTCLDLQYQAKNSQGTLSNTADASVYFLPGSGLNLVVRDAKMPLPAVAGGTDTGKINDYRWIIEEDRTFNIDPATQLNSGSTTPVPALGTNFHVSYMPLVAAGCVGQYACEDGQSLLTVPAVCDQGNGVCRTGASQQVAVDPADVPTIRSAWVTSNPPSNKPAMTPINQALPDAPPPPRTNARALVTGTLRNCKVRDPLMRSGQVKPMLADVV